MLIVDIKVKTSRFATLGTLPNMFTIKFMASFGNDRDPYKNWDFVENVKLVFAILTNYRHWSLFDTV